MKKFCVLSVILMTVFLSANGHCDTMDGPVVAAGKKAIENNNVNYVLPWVGVDDENEIKDAFSLVMKVRILNDDARELADRYFLETVVRIHRTHEGVGYTGIKPAGTPVDEKIKAADESIEKGDLSMLTELVPEESIPELQKRFDKVMDLRNFDVNNVEAGREYVAAYVNFFHFAEESGETNHHGHEPQYH